MTTRLYVYLIFSLFLLLPRNFAHAVSTRYVDKIFDKVTTTKNISYTQGLVLDIYEPQGDAQNNRAAIIWVHGGGFTSGSKENYSGQGPDSAATYAQYGFVSIPINYRLANGEYSTMNSPNIGGPIQSAKQDTLKAVQFIRAHASEYRIDPNKIFVGGFSAGAVTSLYAAYDNPGDANSKIGAAISFSGGMLPPDFSKVNAGDPPAILINGQTDLIVPIQLASPVIDQLKKYNIRNEFLVYNTGHNTRGFADAHEKVRAFLVEVGNLNRDSADFNGDGKVNIIDFTLFISYWFLNNVDNADLNKDGRISAIDYTIFMNAWYESR